MLAAHRTPGAALYGQSTYDRVVLALSGLQNYWPLDEGTGSTYHDLKAGNNATTAAAPAWTTGPDGSGKAANFNSTANSIGLPTSAITITGTHCIFYWIKLNDQTAVDHMSVEWATSGFAQLVQHDIGYSGTVSGFSAGTQMLFSANYGNSVSAPAAEQETRSDLQTGEWFFVAVNMDPTQNNTVELRTFINGAHTGVTYGLTTAHQTGTPGSGVFGIGGRGQGGRNLPLNGALCGVGWLNRAMTQAEMKRLFKAMTGYGAVTTLAENNTTPSFNSTPGIAAMSNGKLLAVWQNSAGDPLPAGDVAKIQALIGSPDGNGDFDWGTFTPTTLFTGATNTTEADASVYTLANGTTRVTWNESTTPGTANINTVTAYKYIDTTNNGTSWSAVTSIAMPGFPSNAAGVAGAYGIAPSPPIQIPVGQTNAGRLLLPVYGWDDKTATGNSNEYAKLMYSDDNGVTWNLLSNITTATTGTDYDETCVYATDTNVLIAEMRTIDGTGTDFEIYQRSSTDWGATWGALVRILGNGTSTGWNGRPSLVQARNKGMLLRARYMSASTSSWSALFTSNNRMSSVSGGIDPFTLGTVQTGTVNSTFRGCDYYGAFAPITGTDLVAYCWSEALRISGHTSNCGVYFRVLKIAPTTV